MPGGGVVAGNCAERGDDADSISARGMDNPHAQIVRSMRTSAMNNPKRRSSVAEA